MNLGRSWGSFLAGDQCGDRGQHRAQVFASAEMARQGPPVLQVADAVLDADPLGRVSPAFGLVCPGDGGEDRDLVLSPGRPRSDDRPGGLLAQPLVAGVGQQGTPRTRASRPAWRTWVKSWMEPGRVCPQHSSHPSVPVIPSALTVVAYSRPSCLLAPRWATTLASVRSGHCRRRCSRVRPAAGAPPRSPG